MSDKPVVSGDAMALNAELRRKVDSLRDGDMTALARARLYITQQQAEINELRDVRDSLRTERDALRDLVRDGAVLMSAVQMEWQCNADIWTTTDEAVNSRVNAWLAKAKEAVSNGE